jgi:glutathione S-transferase
MKLYDYILDADCYKVRLLLGMLGVSYERVKLNVHPGRDHQAPWFLALNPCGEIPVLEDEVVVVATPEAILVYLAAAHDASGVWLPRAPATMAAVIQWLGFAAGKLAALSRARMRDLTGTMLPDDADRGLGRAALQILEDHLVEREIIGCAWIAAPHPTIADIAAFPPAALAPEAGVSLDDYPAIWRWIDRMKRLPGFIVMPGVFPVLPDQVAAS